MPAWVLTLIIGPIIQFLIEEAKRLLGSAATPETISAHVQTQLSSGLSALTHATTKPDDFLSAHLDTISALVDKSIAGLPGLPRL